MLGHFFHPTWVAFFLNAFNVRLFSFDDEILGPLRCFPSLLITLAATIILLYGGTFECILPRAVPWPIRPIMQYLLSAFFLEMAVRHFWIPLETSLTEGIGLTSLAIDEYCRKESTGPWCCLSKITTYFSDECVLGFITYVVASMILLTVMHGAMIIDLRIYKTPMGILKDVQDWCQNPEPPEKSSKPSCKPSRPCGT